MTVYKHDTTLSQPTTAPPGSGAEFRAGTVTLANSAGLPSGVLTFSGGSLLVGVDATLNDGISAANAGAPAPGGVSAGHGVTAVFTGGLSTAADSGLVFGGIAGADGTLVLSGSQAGAVSSASAVDVRGGTVRIAGAAAQVLFGDTAFTSIQQGATLDVGVGYQVLKDFASLGVITSSGGGGVLALAGTGTLGGKVTGALALDVFGATTVTGVVKAATSVETGATLQVGAGGTTGSAVLQKDDGAVAFDRSDAVTVSTAIDGQGSVAQIGSGVLTLGGYDSYAGGTSVSAGVLVDAGYGGVGTGLVKVVQGGELVIGPSQTFANALKINTGVLAAGHGSVVGLTGPMHLNGVLTIGDAAHDGAVVLDGQVSGEASSLTVADGTLALGPDLGQGGGNSLAQATTILAGAAFDLNGVQTELVGLSGQGLLTSSRGPAFLELIDSDFAGAVSGPLSIAVSGKVALHGDVSLTGSGGAFQVNPDATLTLDRATGAAVSFYHPVAPGHIDTSPEALVLGTGAGFTGRVGGWFYNDTVDLKDIAYRGLKGQLAFDSQSDTLSATDGVHTAHIELLGDYALSDFSYGNDGTGHLLVSYPG